MLGLVLFLACGLYQYFKFWQSTQCCKNLKSLFLVYAMWGFHAQKHMDAVQSKSFWDFVCFLYCDTSLTLNFDAIYDPDNVAKI